MPRKNNNGKNGKHGHKSGKNVRKTKNLKAPLSPQPLEVNEIDDFVRQRNGTTIALEMSAQHMLRSKQQENTPDYIYYLSRSNGELRAELSFYRQCFADFTRFKDKTEFQSQELLSECILGLIQSPDLEKIRSISIAITKDVEQLQDRHDQALQIYQSFLEQVSHEKPLPSV